jgi:predicted nucleic acid-binding protein
LAKGKTLRIYLDACAINRLTDDQNQMRIRLETDAMEVVFSHVQAGRVSWIASSILRAELRRNPIAQRREDALAMLAYATEVRVPNSLVADRARALNALGYGEFDALHLAMAENSQVDLLLTTDDRFLRMARRGLGQPSIRVANPLDYAQEVRP